MTLTFDLLTSKSIGRILDSWWVSVWSFMIIGWLQSQLSSGNHFQITMRHDLDLWTPKSIGHILDSWGASVWSFMIIGGLQSQLSSGNHFQTSVMDRQTDWRTDRVQTYSPLRFHRWGTNNHAPWPWPLDPKINRAHPWLMGSKCMKFHDHRWITELVIVRKPFSN